MANSSGSFALCAGPGLTLFSLGQPMQDKAIESSAFYDPALNLAFYFKMYLSYETFMPPIFLFSWSRLFGDKTAL